MFLEFIRRKKVEKFNDDLIKATEGHADLTQIGLSENHQIFKIVINPEAKRTVCFIAGLHGDEEGGPYGILKFLESKFYVPKNKKVILIPIANPTGFEKGTRENADKIDVNRHFMDKELKEECKVVWDAIKDENISLLHTLHEDPDLKTFYLYYTHDKTLAEDLKELATKYFKIFPKGERTPLEQDGVLHKDKIYDGLIPLPHTVRGTIEDKCLIERAIPYITTESPGKADIKKRAEFNKNAIKIVVNGF